jgi:cellulose synthase operon protein C
VLRHEFTHTVTLSATDNRIGHWMTEGLAVAEENIPLRWEWIPLLHNAVKNKQLFTLDNITWAFVRPRKPTDRSLAYAESYWICTYIREKWGQDAPLRMMDLFKAGKSQADVFQQALNISTTDFTRDFFAWTDAQVASWGYDEESSRKYDELVEKADELVKARQYAQAAAAWEAIVKLRPMDQLPHQRLAGIYLSKEARDPPKAMQHLLRLHQVSMKDNRFAKRLARLCIEATDLKQAHVYAFESVYIDPYDLDAHELLLEIAKQTGDQATVAREERVVPVLAAWLQEQRKSTLLPGAPAPP